MDAFMHARMCKNITNELWVEYGINPVLKTNAKSKSFESCNIMCYVHPDDKSKEYIEDFVYPHREL